MYSNRGDTLVEVIFSFAIFSLVVVSSLALMNRGVAMAQHSLEITLVRQQIDSQISLVLHERQLKTSVWESIKSNAQSTTVDFAAATDCPAASSAVPTGGFYIAKNDSGALTYYKINGAGANASYNQAITYSMVDVMRNTVTIPSDATPSYGIWAVLVKAEGNKGTTPKVAYDLHVRSCWSTIGQNKPAAIGTVTRLYD